jgi:excisionase family DNA binding protein
MQSTELKKLTISVREAAAMIGVSQRTIWSLAKSGELPVVKIGTRRLFQISALERFIKEHSTTEPQA